MILGFILIILVMGVGIATSIVSMYLPFMKDLGEIKSYNIAYYGAVAGIERGMSALRYHEPGFEGSSYQTGSLATSKASDFLSGDYGFLNQGENTFGYRITSRTTRIPATGTTNILPVFGSQSEGFYALQYHQLKDFVFTLDMTDASDSSILYTAPTSPLTFFTGEKVALTLRLNPVLYSGFDPQGKLAHNIDHDGDGIKNDTVVNRKREGIYDGETFTIYPDEDMTYFAHSGIVGTDDTMIRELFLNNKALPPATTPNISFENNFDPLVGNSSSITGHNLVSSKKNTLTTMTFKDLFTAGQTETMTLTLSLIKNLFTQGNYIYPFLEYRLVARDGSGNPVNIPALFYTIDTTARVGNYEIRLQSKKPTQEVGIGGDFTIMF